MTTNPNSWTDGYGTVHPGAPPEGYWVASDDRWYAPELHPSYGAAPASSDAAVGQTAAEQTADTGTGQFPEGDPIEQGIAEQGITDHGQKQPIVREPAGPATFDVNALESVLADLEISDGSAPSDWVAPVAAASDPSRAMSDAALPDQTAQDPPVHQPPGPSAPAPTAALAQPTNPDPMAEPSSGPPNRKLIGAVVGIVALLGIGAGAYMAFGGSDDSSVIAGEGPAILANADNDEEPGDTESDATESEAQATFEEVSTALDGSEEAVDAGVDDPAADGSETPAAGTSDIDGVSSCTRVDDQTLVIDMTNVSAETASYLMTVIYTDDAGARVGDDTAYISSLRPNERTLEAVYVFSDAGTGCEVIETERYVRNGTDGLADVSACTVRAPDGATYLEADIDVTNSGVSDSDYTVEVALVDPDGVRKGWGTAYVERAPVGEAIAGEIYTTVPYDEAYQCEVVAVTRLESP